MLLVKTKIGPSKIAGIGLFADEFIAKGTQVWRFQSGLDTRLTQAQFDALSAPAQKQVLNYCYVSPSDNTYVMCGDDARFFNHSDTPNVMSVADEETADIAISDIQPGEELTCNYKNFDDQAVQKLH